MNDQEILSMVRDNVKKLTAYSTARDEFKGQASVFLDANENPFPSDFNRYPDPHQKELKKVISEMKSVGIENIFLGNGSDEAIDLLFRIFCEPGRDRVITTQPTYAMYQVSAGVNNVAMDVVPLSRDFELSASELLKHVTSVTKIIFLCSPNNPSGNLLNSKQIETLLKGFHGIVALDEAYIDFVDAPSWTTRLAEFPNLVVLQTLSKAWGLASLRIGMAFAGKPIIDLLNKIKPPYNISGLTQKTAVEILTTHKTEIEQAVAAITRERKKLVTSLQKSGIVEKIFPSDANFILVKVNQAKHVYDQLMKRGIIVRDRSGVLLCENCLRITVGTPEENDRLIEAMNSL